MNLRTAVTRWPLRVVAPLVLAACTYGPTGAFGPSPDEPPDLDEDSGVSLACVNLQCDNVSCPAGKTTTLSGTVYDPAGRLPLYNAIVYVPNAAVLPFESGASCQQCGSVASGDPVTVTLTDEQGHFVLSGVPVADDLPLVIQIGRWRRQLKVAHVAACADTPVPVADTRLPRNQQEGDIPLIALTTGAFDPLECLIRKIGVDDEEFTGGDGPGRIHLYQGIGGGGVPTSTPSETLYPQIERYDEVVLACEGETYPQNKPMDATYAMLEYVNKGGRAFASHYQYYWFAPLPNGSGVFPNVADWAEDSPTPDTVYDLINVGFPKGQAFFNWLTTVGAFDQYGLLEIDQACHDVDFPMQPYSLSWLHNDPKLISAAVQLLTFNMPVGVTPPSQCGRVVYSDMHVASQDSPGLPFPTGCVTTTLSPQEKALEFMFFDLASCIQDDTVPPVVPAAPLK